MDEKMKSSPNNIDQIRHLIFGDQIQDYERRFQEVIKKTDQLKKLVQEQKTDIDAQIKALEQTIMKTLSDSQEAIHKEIKNQMQSLKKDLASLEAHQSEIAEDKLDRSLLADRLIDLAMALKGESLLDQFGKDNPTDA
ncbi:hypothetical protein JW948_12440 [bacterium]|nr:hypothetical protein [bacterium]